MKLAIHFPSEKGVPQTIEIDTDRVRIGRDSRCEVVIDGKRFPKVSGLHAELVMKNGQTWLVHRSKSNSTVVGDQVVEKPVATRIGTRFRLGFTGPEIEVLELSEAAGQTIFAANASDYLSPEQLSSNKFQLNDGGILGRDENATFRLEHPHVSRRHAAIKIQNGVAVVADLGSSNGTFVDGERIAGTRELSVGSKVGIGPFSLVYDGQCLISRTRLNNSRLSVNDLHYVINERVSKRKIHLLSAVSFSVEPGEFVAVLGPSGSGKSTLLRIASGREWPFSGNTKINDQDLHEEFSILKEDIVVVPQSTRFHDVLSVRDVISYAASLRLPIDTDREERNSVVDLSLARVGLEERAETKVSNLSGGQQKRLALANELVSDPSLLFLDEVTSGLDEKSDGEMMQLLRTLAETGKTIVCVTHNLGHIEAYCHKVLILTVGGRVAFYGKSTDALAYFGVDSIGDIYDILATRTPEQWAVRFLNSNFGGNVSADANNPTGSERITSELSSFQRLGLRPLSQTVVLVKRYLDIWRNDWQALLALFGQAAMVTILLCLVFSSIPGSDEQAELLTRKSELRNLLFLVGISCFWLGANNAAKELVKERVIYERERNFNLSPEAYWISKVIVLSFVGFAQSAILTVGVIIFCDIPGSLMSFLACSLLLSAIGTNLGLAISALSKTEELSVALVPIVVIPQIILAGVVAQLNDASSFLAKAFTTSYWGQKLYEDILPDADRFISEPKTNLSLAIGVLLCQLVIFAAISWWGIRVRKTNAI